MLEVGCKWVSLAACKEARQIAYLFCPVGITYLSQNPFSRDILSQNLAQIEALSGCITPLKASILSLILGEE
jgi:hypothetical protein